MLKCLTQRTVELYPHFHTIVGSKLNPMHSHRPWLADPWVDPRVRGARPGPFAPRCNSGACEGQLKRGRAQLNLGLSEGDVRELLGWALRVTLTEHAGREAQRRRSKFIKQILGDFRTFRDVCWDFFFLRPLHYRHPHINSAHAYLSIA